MVPELRFELGPACAERILGPLHQQYASRLSGVQRELESRNGPMGSGLAFPESGAGIVERHRRPDSWAIRASLALRL